MGHRLSAILADILAPRMCVGCWSEGSWCCENCAAIITREPNVTCLGCARVSPNGTTCDQCRPKLKLDSVTAVAPYTDTTIQRLIHLVKYAPARDVAGAFRLFIAQARFPVEADALIVPVPLHWRRELERGFNQSRLLAEAVSSVLGGEVGDVLIRTKRTASQVELAHDARGANVRGAFTCEKPDIVRGRNVLLIDDVVTTGATIGECARALHVAGARSAHAFVLARG